MVVLVHFMKLAMPYPAEYPLRAEIHLERDLASPRVRPSVYHTLLLTRTNDHAVFTFG